MCCCAIYRLPPARATDAYQASPESRNPLVPVPLRPPSPPGPRQRRGPGRGAQGPFANQKNRSAARERGRPALCANVLDEFVRALLPRSTSRRAGRPVGSTPLRVRTAFFKAAMFLLHCYPPSLKEGYRRAALARGCSWSPMRSLRAPSHANDSNLNPSSSIRYPCALAEASERPTVVTVLGIVSTSRTSGRICTTKPIPRRERVACCRGNPSGRAFGT